MLEKSLQGSFCYLHFKDEESMWQLSWSETGLLAFQGSKWPVVLQADVGHWEERGSQSAAGFNKDITEPGEAETLHF